jgi:hypothetical protein
MITLFSPGPEHGQVAELEILVEGDPLCVAGVWDWKKRERVQGLYFVYLKRLGLHFGPFYAEIGLAANDMKKALKAFPSGFWSQRLEWYGRQDGFKKWVEENMGKAEDLVGAEWARD